MKRGLIISEQDKKHINGLYGLISEEEQIISQVKQELNGVLSQVGIELSDEEVKETLQDCPIEEPSNPEEAGYVNQIISKLDGMNLSQLVKELKNLLKIKDEPIKEQIGSTIIIAGVSVPTLIAFGVAAILVLAIIGMIGRLIGGRGFGRRRCGRRRTLLQRIGGLFRKR
tara:strand:- start:47 stop:556 length:510 start_codon:yes stop_codon:yes gene_type:complete